MSREPSRKLEFRFSPRPNKADLINWREWGKFAFLESARTNKPILLSLSAVWCHWCHVMDETTYSNEAVISFINEHFIPIRVDSDQRPEINSRYNMGGLPSTVFLTSQGEIITGTTFLPPERMLAVLPRIIDFYRQEQRIEKNQDDKSFAGQMLQTQEQGITALSHHSWLEVADFVFGLCVENFDYEFGGLGTSMKFPHTNVLRFLLNYYLLRGEDRALGMLTNTLLQMYMRGLFDKIEGGFFRYSVSRDWSQPHFEKMLSDNCELAELYLDYWLVSGEKLFLNIARETLNYISHNLTEAESGGFYLSQDADEDYYKLELTQRRQRQKPFIDPLLYSGPSALASATFLRCGLLLNNDDYLLQAEKTLERIWQQSFVQGRGVKHLLNSPADVFLLSDQVDIVMSFITATFVLARRHWLSRALTLVATTLENFNEQTAALADISKDGEKIGLLSQPRYPLVENARFVSALSILEKLTATDFSNRISSILAHFCANYQSYHIYACELANALIYSAHPLIVCHLILPPDNLSNRKVLRELNSFYEPRLIVNPLVAGTDDALIHQNNFSTEKLPVFYLCIWKTCLPPCYSIESMIKEINNHLAI